VPNIFITKFTYHIYTYIFSFQIVYSKLC